MCLSDKHLFPLMLLAPLMERGWHQPCHDRHPRLRQFLLLISHPSPLQDQMLVGIYETKGNSTSRIVPSPQL